MAGSIIKGATFTLGLVGSLALFKQLESMLDPYNSEGKEFLGGLIKDLTAKMKELKKKQNILGNTDSHWTSYGDVTWLLISAMLGVLLHTCNNDKTMCSGILQEEK